MLKKIHVKDITVKLQNPKDKEKILRRKEQMT